ncbi:MAG: A24 family peptidase [Ardenticatenaceae bacterium]|nr:A24 family peptidase [Ardenticatenaceae bacterium]
MINLLFAIIGFLVGGVINALADDLPKRRAVQMPHCPNCGYKHAPSGWLGLTRAILHRGQCPNCGEAERRRTLLVEIGTAVVFAVLPFFFSTWPGLLITAFYFAILILVIVIDMEHRLILHIVTFPTTLLAIALSPLMENGNTWLSALVGAAVGFVFFYVLYWIGNLTFGPGALGFGDVTLSMTMGAMLGFEFILFALILGILLGGIISFILILARVLHRRSRIPYGEFLATAGMVMLLWGPQIVDWYFG